MTETNNVWRLPAVLTVAFALALGITAQRSAVVPQIEKIMPEAAKPPPSSTPVQISFFPGASGQLFPSKFSVYGFSAGTVVMQKEIHGLSLAGIHAFNEKKNGISLSLWDACYESNGLSMSVAGGAVRNKGMALGLWNLAEHNEGLQLGLVNQVKRNAIFDSDLRETKKPEGFGVQTGLINYSEGRGVQFGLWNSNPDGLLPGFPLFNIVL